VGIIQKRGQNRVLPVLELLPKRAFYDYKAKYQKGLTDFIIPARIPPRKARQVMALALKVHELLNCHGVSRTDFILDEKSGVPYCLELNTLPGLTPLSDIPAQARAAGITYDELIYHILASALTSKRSMKKAIYHD
jgi:D-alanine-D-alanine ligase